MEAKTLEITGKAAILEHEDSPKPSENSSTPSEDSSEPSREVKEPMDPNVVDFDLDDPSNPMNWPSWRKWTTLLLVSAMNMLAVFATTTIVPAVPQVLEGFKVSNNLYSTLLVSIWDLGEAFGPLLVAPLSELYGRMPVYHIGNLLALACSIAGALSTNISMLVAMRFLNGLVMTATTISPSMVGDLFEKEERGTAMAVSLTFAIIGPFISPPIGGAVAGTLGWRWTIWLVAILVGFFTVLSLLFCRETYQVKILEQKTKRLRKCTNNPSLRSKHQKRVDGTSLVQSFTRPMRMLFCAPIVFIISFYTAFSYGVSYLILTTLTESVENVYHFGQKVIGLVFLSCAIGNVIGMFAYGLTSDRYIKFRKRKEGVFKPEHRLVHMLFGSVTLPLGLFLYGWTIRPSITWVIPLIGTTVIGFSMLLAVLPTENYLVDVYELHGASAIAAGVMLRSLFGALFPLVGPPLYSSLGLGWGNSVVAFIAIAFIPFLILLMRLGERIRANPRFLQDR